jgi:glycosyltransferase involved in cell wall biosynthesis
MKISVYTSAFNLIQHGFKGWRESISRACDFADEVVVCINKSQDDTLIEFSQIGLKKLKIVVSDFSYEDPLLDGKVKNTALQNCSGDILIQLDIDEYIPENQYSNWRAYAEHLFNNQDVDCYMIPALNLYKDWDHYKDINSKWYMHKRGFYRGPVGFARKSDGTIDTNRSDTCELIDAYGCLVRSTLLPNTIEDLRNGSIFVVHFGYVDLDSRIERNQKFWDEHWRRESGGKTPPHKVHMKKEDFEGEGCLVHNLNLM